MFGFGITINYTQEKLHREGERKLNFISTMRDTSIRDSLGSYFPVTLKNLKFVRHFQKTTPLTSENIASALILRATLVRTTHRLFY